MSVSDNKSLLSEIMIADCERQREYNDYGNETIDKPGWVKWEQELWAERDRRKTDG